MRRALAAMLSAGLLMTSWPQPGAAQDILPGRTRDVRAACTGDYFRFCRDVPPGAGRVLVCMHLNAERLSPRCFEALTAWGLAAAGAFKACLPDAQRFCSHVPSGQGRGLACIMQNADRLSRPCRDALTGQDVFESLPGPRSGLR